MLLFLTASAASVSRTLEKEDCETSGASLVLAGCCCLPLCMRNSYGRSKEKARSVLNALYVSRADRFGFRFEFQIQVEGERTGENRALFVSSAAVIGRSKRLSVERKLGAALRA